MAENNSNSTKDLNLEIPEAKQIPRKINQGKLHQDTSKNCQHRIIYPVAPGPQSFQVTAPR